MAPAPIDPAPPGTAVLTARDGGVATVTMNRPERLNAMNDDLVTRLRDYFQQLSAESPERVVILQGAGRVFCAGLDLKDRMDSDPSGQAHKGVAIGLARQKSIRDIMLAMRRCPQPIISVIQGAASGGGLGLAIASDIRLATPEARMNAAFIRIGLTGCDMGSSYFLPRMVGASVASELLLTGRFIDAQRALSLGLVSKVGTLDEIQAEARQLADEMLATTPLGLRLTKDCLNQNIDIGSFEAAIAMEDRNQILAAQSEDFAEGIRAFMEKRKPHYTGR